MNSFVWFLLASREPAKLQQALPLAIRANELSDHMDPDYLDTLALAYHLTGDTLRAIDVQTEAIELLPAGESSVRSEFEARLARYKSALSGGDVGDG